MSDPRTKIEFLYKEVLGDVTDVVARVEGIKSTVPAAMDAAAGRVQEQSNALLQAAQKLYSVLKLMSKEVDEHADASVKAAVERGKAELRTAAEQAVVNALANSGVGDQVKEAVDQINQAAQAFATQAGEAKTGIHKASNEVSWGAYKLMAMLAGVSLVAALVGGFVAARAASLSSEDAKALEVGRTISKAWTALTPKERERFSELAKAQK